MKRVSYSVEEAKDIVNRLFVNCKRLNTVGTARVLVEESKHLITLCNSLSVMFMEYTLLEEASYVVNIAGEADKFIDEFGNYIERSWQGRLLCYTNISCFYYLKGNYHHCLAALYRAQELSIFISEGSEPPNSDILLAASLLTFIALWKISEFAESRKYL